MAGLISSIVNAVSGSTTGGGVGRGGNLRVTVIEGRNLARKDFFSKSDPYCVLTIHSKMNIALFAQKQQTAVINNNQSPFWNQTFFMSVKNPQTDLLKITVYDSDPGRDDVIGAVEIPLFDLMNGVPKQEWYQLYPPNGGSIHLVLLAEGFGAAPGYGMGGQQGMAMQGAGYPQQGYPQQQQQPYPCGPQYGAAYGGFPPRQPYGAQGSSPAAYGGYPGQQPGMAPFAGATYPPQAGYGGYPPPAGYPSY